MNVHELVAIDLDIDPALVSIETSEGDEAVATILRHGQLPIGASCIHVVLRYPDRFCSDEDCDCGGQGRALAATLPVSCTAEVRRAAEDDGVPGAVETRRRIAADIVVLLRSTAPPGMLEHLSTHPIEGPPS